ncbi:MAG: [protein-PII] uridylyltransferase [Desulfobacteraceae bacterium]|nr:[protein-PII] uridylyltransferase [Desulfobacteraceae bacterium]
MAIADPGATPHKRFTSLITALSDRKTHLVTGLLGVHADKYLSRHSESFDDYFRSAFEKSNVGLELNMSRNPYALIAQGGYGRGEQCIYSDVDLLFLFAKKVPSTAESLVREIVYPLWDLGIEVGHATRSIEECTTLAESDYEVLTSLLDARFICGFSPLYSQMMEALHGRITRRRPDQIVNLLIDSNRLRHERFGDSAYLLEPNLKEGRGGLRDYHTMLWIARIKSNIKQRRDLEYVGYVSSDEYHEMMRALTFIWRVRNHLHLLCRRKCDQLYLEYQTRLAEAMGFADTDGRLPVESMLGELHHHMEFLKQQHLMFLYDLEQQKKLRRKNSVLKTTDVKGLKFNRGMLNFESAEHILNDPLLLFKIFLESTTKKAPLNPEAKRLVSDFAYLVDDEFRAHPEVTRMFEQILLKPAPNFNALNQMLHTGLLVKYIPEFEKAVNRIQFDQYHLYPVVRHLLYAVRMVKQLGSRSHPNQDPFLRNIYKSLKNKRVLLWATLLHDIGKAVPAAGHSKRGALTAEDILIAKGLKKNEIETVSFLIHEHLLLIKTATRRDINDEETCVSVARTVKTLERLKMLYLLSVADAMATGPKAWNDWTSSLLKSLFIKIIKILEKGELAARWAVAATEKKKIKLLESAQSPEARKQIEALLGIMSPRYLIYTAERRIPRHVELFQRLGQQGFVWEIDKSNDAARRTVTICAKDRPGLISKIAGVFTLDNIYILDVQIYTWRNNVAVDIFEVRTPPDSIREDEKWAKAESDLRRALSGELDLGKALQHKKSEYRSIREHTSDRPQQVFIDNEISSFYTIVEVVAWDVPGLLYDITNALFTCGLDVWVAKIATKVDQVMDVFYVRDVDGQKADSPEQMAAIKSAIEEVINEN